MGRAHLRALAHGARDTRRDAGTGRSRRCVLFLVAREGIYLAALFVAASLPFGRHAA